MTVFILSFVVMLAIVLAMSVGVLMGRKPIKGTCGGMSALGVGTACDICGGDTRKCEEEQDSYSKIKGSAQSDSNPLAYSAVENKAAEKKPDTNRP